ncbi:MAG: FHA domain-containing protein [Candidatus Binataceae bacterium]
MPIDSPNPRRLRLAKRKLTIGSDPRSDIVLSDIHVSREHATMRRLCGILILHDLKSTNGTFINGRRVKGYARVRLHDEVRFGTTRMRLANLPRDGRVSQVRKIVSLASMCFVVSFLLVSFGAGWELLTTTGTVTRNASAVPPKSMSAVHPEKRNAAPLPISAPAYNESDAQLALRQINYWRANSHTLAPVVEDKEWGRGDFDHARYLVKTYESNPYRPVSITMHTEDPASPWYTPEGSMAGGDGDLIPPCRGCLSYSAAQAVNMWMIGPFHRLAILNPRLTKIGFAIYREDGVQSAALRLGLAPTPQSEFNPLIEFPTDGALMPSSMARLNLETPSPIASCPGYSAPVGLPITLEFGPAVHIKMVTAAITRAAVTLESCAFTGETYTNPDAVLQGWGRNILREFGAVVVVPRKPLAPGGYQVTLAINDLPRRYSWSFFINH